MLRACVAAVDARDAQLRSRQVADRPGGRTPDKTGVLTDLDFRERVTGPPGFAICERIASDPCVHRLGTGNAMRAQPTHRGNIMCWYRRFGPDTVLARRPACGYGQQDTSRHHPSGR